MVDYKKIKSFYKGKRVLVTGNTGFKGSWLTRILTNSGAYVTGYSLEPTTTPSLFQLAGLEKHPGLYQVTGDVRDLERLKMAFQTSKPEIVIHLAAQPIVRDSYRNPLETYSINVMGTVNVLECIRTVPGVKSFLNVTTDKVYENNEWEYGYRENDPLDGFDPYSNSKSCSELVTHSYRNSFFSDNSVSISTARAGNVIGGGDFANDRIIPDAVRAVKIAMEEGRDKAVIAVRNPYSIRPYQHVLEPLFMYLTIAAKQYGDASFASYYNVGPDDCDCVTTGQLTDLFCNKWNDVVSELPKNSRKIKWPEISWINKAERNAPHEAGFLKLDCSRVKKAFGWKPAWHIDKAVEETVKFTKVWLTGGDVASEMDRQVLEYMEDITFTGGKQRIGKSGR